MRKYFIHKDDKQLGPFSKNELVDLKITRKTLVWFEGEEDWKTAAQVDDLQDLFKSSPPPLRKKRLLSRAMLTIFRIPTSKKSSFLITIISVIVIGSIVTVIYMKQKERQDEIEMQLEEQNAKIQEQERLESERNTNGGNVKILWKDREGREFAIMAPSGEFTYGMLNGDGISYNMEGRISHVGPVYISYDMEGRIVKVGSVYISYNYTGEVTHVGGLYVKYDYDGKITGTSGSVN